MTPWAYLRLAIVAASFVGGAFGASRLSDQGVPTFQSLLFIFAGGIFGMLFVIGIQRMNPRSAAAWRYPSWLVNPFTMREPLQFFHLGGYFFLASGVGSLLRWYFVRTTPLFEPLLFTAWGCGVLIGVRLCTIVFRGKMAGA